MTNPLLEAWDGPFGLPDFSAITEDHFTPAFDAALDAQTAEFEAIATNPDAPTFANTVEALERHGLLLDRVLTVFWNRAGSDTNDAIQALEREFSPRLSKHFAKCNSDPRIHARLQAVRDGDEALTAEQSRVLD
ncbi:MAG: peptidase M3, partial [Pseudomonadota bacterium]